VHSVPSDGTTVTIRVPSVASVRPGSADALELPPR
jgi:hypothetical protein